MALFPPVVNSVNPIFERSGSNLFDFNALFPHSNMQLPNATDLVNNYINAERQFYQRLRDMFTFMRIQPVAGQPTIQSRERNAGY